VSPKFFAPVAKQLGPSRNSLKRRMANGPGSSSKSRSEEIWIQPRTEPRAQEILDEQQIYRIDHYLGKETVQNLMVVSGSRMPSPSLCGTATSSDSVQITAAETVGVEQRGGFYETPALCATWFPITSFSCFRLLPWRPPISFDADAVRDKQAEILHAVQVPNPEDVSRDRSSAGSTGTVVAQGSDLLGYRREPKVSPTSHTETYVALRLQIDNWRWAGVPFYLRTGKRLPRRTTEIAIQFRRSPFVLFRKTKIADLQNQSSRYPYSNPTRAFPFVLAPRYPGPVMPVGLVNMEFDYARDFGRSHSNGI